MSERGTFVTSFLYDQSVVGALRSELPKIAKCITEIVTTDSLEQRVTRAFTGIIRSSYSGGEAAYMEQWLDEELLPVLPQEFGHFEIAVLPENAIDLRLFKVTDTRRGETAQAKRHTLYRDHSAVLRP